MLCGLCCREMAIKFNDYFEFPREFDMAPYTAATLAEVEGTYIVCAFLLVSYPSLFCLGSFSPSFILSSLPLPPPAFLPSLPLPPSLPPLPVQV